jgi:proline iminopeptidase
MKLKSSLFLFPYFIFYLLISCVFRSAGVPGRVAHVAGTEARPPEGVVMAEEKSNEGYITVDDGTRLFFKKIGSGPKVVIIPNGFYFLDDFARFSAGRTLIFYDVRNRGLSDTVTDPAKLSRGILQDVDDLDAVRRHFQLEQLDLIGHSYIGLMVGLYAMKYPKHPNRIVMIGPAPYDANKEYPPELTNTDGVLQEVFAKLGQLQQELANENPEERCNKVWSVLRRIYVADAADAEKINFGRCELPNERNMMTYWTKTILPSIQNLRLADSDFAKAQALMLIIHGTRDRSSAYGGGRDWARMFSNARLLTLENVAHAPWIEAPEKVFPAIETFLAGAWPENTERISSR